MFAVGRWFAVIPAAGRSVRMGEPKLLLDVADGCLWLPMIQKVIRTWRRALPSPAAIVVTVHPEDAALAERCREVGADVVQPVEPPPDMKASIAAALDYLQAHHAPAPNDAWLTAPADLPGLSSTVIETLLCSYDRAAPRIIRPTHAGRFGHPTLLPWTTTTNVNEIPTNRGLDYLLKQLPFAAVEAGDACLTGDVDTPADYRRLQDR